MALSCVHIMGFVACRVSAYKSKVVSPRPKDPVEHYQEITPGESIGTIGELL